MAKDSDKRGAGGQVPPLRVMVIEDHEHVLWGLRKLIFGEWPRLVLSATARDVFEARAALREYPVDVVVLDLFLAGEFALEHLPDAIAASGAALIVLTEARDPKLHQRAFECGALAVVLKDEPAGTLLGHIQRARRGSRPEGDAASGANELPVAAGRVAIPRPHTTQGDPK